MKLFKSTTHKFKRLLLKNYIWYKKNFVSTDMKDIELSVNQLKALSIATYVLKNQSSELSLCPITDKRYIKYNDYFIVITEDRIQLVNHVYAYDVNLSGKKFYNLKKNFDTKLYKKFKSIEDEILSNVKHSLDTILSDIKQSNE
jgi:hypothetical protein